MKKNLFTASVILMGFLIPFATSHAQQNDNSGIPEGPSNGVYKRAEKGRKRALKKVWKYHESLIELSIMKKNTTIPALENAYDTLTTQIQSIENSAGLSDSIKNEMTKPLEDGRAKILVWIKESEEQIPKLREIPKTWLDGTGKNQEVIRPKTYFWGMLKEETEIKAM